MAQMETKCHLAALPVELLPGIIVHLDIRSAARLALTCKSFTVGACLLQGHPDYPFLSAVRSGNGFELPSELSRLVSRSPLGPKDDCNWPKAGSLMSLLEACVWILMVDRNESDPTLWAPLHFLAEKHLPTLAACTRSVLVERAVMEAYRRGHFRAIIALAQLAAAETIQFCKYSLFLWPVVEEICARKTATIALSAKAKHDLLHAMLLLLDVEDVAAEDFVLCVAHPNNSVATVVHLMLVQFESWADYRGQCLPLLLDACGKYDRPDMLNLFMELYVLGQFTGQPSPSTEDSNSQPPNDTLHSLQAQFAGFGVLPNTTLEFQTLLTECSWHRDFVPWILGIASSTKYPHLALDWFLSHVRVNLTMIHYLPLALRTPLGHVKPESLRVLLAKFPIDISPGQTQHGPKDGTDDEMLVWSYESHTDDCLRCQEILATAAEGAKRAGSSSGSVSARDAYFKVIAEEPAGHCQVWSDPRPEGIVREEMDAVRALLLESSKRSQVQAPARDGAIDWALADWARDLMTGAEVYELWVVASQLQSTALPFPISFGAVMNALLELHDFERALCLLNYHQSKLQVGGDGHGWDWVVTERAIATMIRALEGGSKTSTADACCRFLSQLLAANHFELRRKDTRLDQLWLLYDECTANGGS